MRSPYPSSIDQESTRDQMWDNRRMVRGKIAFLFIGIIIRISHA